MNLLLDTHVWVRWLSANQPLPDRIVSLIEEAEVLNISAISCWEVAYLVKRNRLELSLSLSDWMKFSLEGSGVVYYRSGLPSLLDRGISASLRED